MRRTRAKKKCTTAEAPRAPRAWAENAETFVNKPLLPFHATPLRPQFFLRTSAVSFCPLGWNCL